MAVDPHLQAFKAQRYAARQRKVPWSFDIWEWLQIWQDSGHLADRGNKKGQWVMGRNGDTGAYEADNVKIIRVESNTCDAHAKRVYPLEDAEKPAGASEASAATRPPPT